jgi:hypothetical protein
MAKKIVMSQEHIIFRSDPYIMSSALVQKSFKFTLQWRAWKHRLVLINKEGQLGYGNGNDTYVSGMLNIKDCMVTYVPDDLLLAVLAPEQLNKFTGITIKCKTSAAMGAEEADEKETEGDHSSAVRFSSGGGPLAAVRSQSTGHSGRGGDSHRMAEASAASRDLGGCFGGYGEGSPGVRLVPRSPSPSPPQRRRASSGGAGITTTSLRRGGGGGGGGEGSVGESAEGEQRRRRDSAASEGELR